MVVAGRLEVDYKKRVMREGGYYYKLMKVVGDYYSSMRVVD